MLCAAAPPAVARVRLNGCSARSASNTAVPLCRPADVPVRAMWILPQHLSLATGWQAVAVHKGDTDFARPVQQCLPDSTYCWSLMFGASSGGVASLLGWFSHALEGLHDAQEHLGKLAGFVQGIGPMSTCIGQTHHCVAGRDGFVSLPAR